MQERVHKPAPRGTEEAAEPMPKPDTAEARAKVELSDDLLDEIDELLENDAQEFVAAFVQKGGQ